MKSTKKSFVLKLSPIVLCLIWNVGFIKAQNTPVAKNGQLKVIGTKLCNQYGNPIQLRGMSTHGIQWYYNCLTDASLNALANDWGADVLRIALYVQEGGYETDPTGFTSKVNTLIEKATARGMYVIVDWHQLDPGDPNYNLANAKKFFTDIANTHKNKNNIIYDIANEPNNVTWAKIKSYADQMIPVIRAIDSDAVILCGTHGWGSMGISDGRNSQDIINNPITHSNFMYTFHFYATSHREEYLNELNYASDRLPIFITEFGTQEYTGDGPNDFTMSQKYIDLLRQKKISWTSWNYSDDPRTGASWKVGTCSNGPWTVGNLKPAGVWVRDKILTPADDFPGGSNPSPTISIASPVNGATFNAPASITINANATDDGSVAKVEFYNGSTKLGEDATSPYSYQWNNVATGAYTITAKATDNLGATATSSAVNITVSGTSAPNLALNKSVTVSSTEATGFEGSKAVDGNVTTRWASLAGVDPQWIYVDLGANYSVTQVKITWEAAYGKDYQVQISSNASSWTTLKTVAGNTTLVNNHTALSGSGRYVRINGTARGTTYGYSIFELEVYGTPAPGNQAPIVSITSPANGSGFASPATVAINATASDADGSVAKVEFFNGSTKLGEDASSPYSFSWSNVAAGTYSLTAKATDNAGAVTTSSTVSITVSETTVTNLALNKSVTVSSIETTGFEGPKAVDGSATTRWASLEGRNLEWIYVNLGAVYNVNRVKITWEAAYGKDYQVQISSDASTWSTLKTITGNTALVNDHTALSGSGRYVRINCTARGTAYGYSIFELEVYGSSSSARIESKEVSLEKGIVSFPNPAADKVTIQLSPYWQKSGKISLQNSKGRTLFSETTSDATHTFDLSSFPSGLYFIQISNKKDRIIHKFMKR